MVTDTEKRCTNVEDWKEYFGTWLAANGVNQLPENSYWTKMIAYYRSEQRPLLTEQLMAFGAAERFWVLREAHRFITNEYMAVQFPGNSPGDENLRMYLGANPLHFIHLSKDEPLYVAYTPDANYGKQDRRVKTTIGRYLKKHFPKMTDGDIRALSDTFKYHFSVEDVLFASTEDEMIDVYRNGPHSCMSYGLDSGNLQSHIHPVAAYAVPGMKVAYLRREGKINSRCLIYDNPNNNADKRYVRVYGDELLARKLETLGYTRGPLKDIVLRKIPAQTLDGRVMHNTFVVPYIDDTSSDSRTYQGLQVLEDGIKVVHRDSPDRTFVGSNTNGLLGDNQQYNRGANDSYRIVNRTAGTEEDSLADIRMRQPCRHCGTMFRVTGGHQLDQAGQNVCPSCVSSRNMVVAIVNTDGMERLIPSENAVLTRSGARFLNDDVLLAAAGIVTLSPERYSGSGFTHAHRTEIAVYHDEVILRSDLVASYGHTVTFRGEVIVSARMIKLPTKMPYDLMLSLRVDTVNGMLRSITDTSLKPLGEWFVDTAERVAPEARYEFLESTLHGETEAVLKRVFSYWNDALIASNNEQLITGTANRDVQLTLAAVEED